MHAHTTSFVSWQVKQTQLPGHVHRTFLNFTRSFFITVHSLHLTSPSARTWKCLHSRLRLAHRHDSQHQERYRSNTTYPCKDYRERMPPRTRKQSSTKAADTSKQEPETEHAKGAEPKSMFSRLPPELQKTVVEYVGPIPCHPAISHRLTDPT